MGIRAPVHRFLCRQFWGLGTPAAMINHIKQSPAGMIITYA